MVTEHVGADEAYADELKTMRQDLQSVEVHATTVQVVEAPGVYDGMPADVYINDPVPGGSLSSTGARKLLPPSCPAAFRWWADNGEAPKRAYDFGHAAHLEVLGIGPPVTVVDATDWKTKAAQLQRDTAYAGGFVPLLVHEWQMVQAMAAALRAHPFASALFNPDYGSPEQSLFWQDDETGVFLRARLDFLPKWHGGRAIVPDYKTAPSAAKDAVSRSIYAYGYHQQGSFYVDGAIALDLAGDDTAFVLVVQEKQPPYLVNVLEPDVVAMRIGRRRNRQAIDLYAECKATDTWPGYSSDVELVGLPPWAERQEDW
jgi:hypothetical protein